LIAVKVARDAAEKEAKNTGQPVKDAGSVVRDHVSLIEKSLTLFYKTYSKELKEAPIGFIIVVAPLIANRVPMIYHTERAMLELKAQNISLTELERHCLIYFAGRLFQWDRMDKPTLAILAAFILREVEASASGVGLGNDMVFIHERKNELHYIYKDHVRELQSGIPKLEDSLMSHWTQHATAPAWINTDAKP